MAQKFAPNSFNELHSAFVTTEDGTTLSELVQVLGSIALTPILVPLLTPWVLPRSFISQAISNKDFFLFIRAILEYPILTILPIFIVTLIAGDKPDSDSFSKSSGAGLITLFCCAIGILIVNHAITAPKWPGFIRQWEKIKDMPTGWSKVGQPENEVNQPSQGKLPFITNYRAIVIYITVLCILAVDFPIFPRRFSKTRSYGISLMDVGTGCFVFANGIVAPEARNKRSPLSSSFKSTIPIVILGFVRLVSVKGIEYHEVVEEYGVHWNFFFTLAGVKLLSSLLFALFDPSHGLKLAASVCLVYELILNHDDLLNKYIMNPDIKRSESLINANREGIFSVAGYLSIYLASVYIGRIITWKHRTSVRDWLGYAAQSFLQIFILWGLYAICTHYGSQPSRRAANASFVLLMVALNYSLMWSQVLVTLIQVTLQHLGLIYGPILFYELDKLHNKKTDTTETSHRLNKDFSKVKQMNDTASDYDIDKKLQHLEERLGNAMKMLSNCQPESQTEVELLQEISALENEMGELEGKLCGSEEETESLNVERNEGKNLVLLPDLSRAPVFLEAICYNGLAVFLLGNLVTGLINYMIYTMYC